MTFNWQIDVGNILVYIAWALLLIWGAYHALDRRVTAFEVLLTGYARTLTEHAERMSKHEDAIVEIVKDLQRLIGRSEVERMQYRAAHSEYSEG